MKEKVAVATVQGKPYFLLVKQLRENNIPFVSLVPGESVPAKVRLVITTDREKDLVKHDKVLVFHNENELDNIVNEVKKTLLGKEKYEKIVIGLDPGEATGLAVLADGKVIEQSNCYTMHEVVNTILKSISKLFSDDSHR
jgi:activator of 2-hydroxyglutaryl-CoA dehydratase